MLSFTPCTIIFSNCTNLQQAETQEYVCRNIIDVRSIIDVRNIIDVRVTPSSVRVHALYYHFIDPLFNAIRSSRHS